MDPNVEFEERMKAAFRAMDTDESGFLEVPELEAALKSVGDFTKTEIETIIKKMLEDDENGDGKLSLEEFLKGVMKGKGKLEK